jgi:APA family basic amino acid/polyamine antiporter
VTARGATMPALARRLGTVDAVVIGLGSMIGAGVFSAFAPAAAAAGSALLIGLALAAGVAFCNATASAQLAARYPTSGGTYIYGRERLGPWWGFTAGWGFVIGKTASCAAMALTFGAYALPGQPAAQRALGIVAVLALTTVNLRGITRTAGLARILVAGSLLALGVVVAVALTSGHADPANLTSTALAISPYGVLQSAGLLFFAFAGYARIATLGEEVRDPARTIPRAIPIALGITIAVYLLVGASALLVVGPLAIAGSPTPLATAVDAAGASWTEPIVRAGAIAASLGSLLALIAGVGRTTLAMAREGDMPATLAAVDERHSVPHHAEVAIAAAVLVLVVFTDLRGAIGFSSFGVLVYYAVANAAAFSQPATERRWPRALNVVGLIGCLVLVATLPIAAVGAGLLMFAVGLGARAVARRNERRETPNPAG